MSLLFVVSLFLIAFSQDWNFNRDLAQLYVGTFCGVPNSLVDRICDPYQFYQNTNCANYVSQSIASGGVY